MTAIAKLFRVRIATAGATAVDGNVDFTLQATLKEAPSTGGQTVRPLVGRTESAPWTVEVVDTDGGFTAQLAGADGRLDVIGRLLDVQVSTNAGGAWTTLTTGRLGDLDQEPDVVIYRLGVQDERLVERTSLIWNKGNTVSLYPPGTIVGYGQNAGFGQFPIAPGRRWTVVAVASGNRVGLQPSAPAPSETIILEIPIGNSPNLADYIAGDLRADALPLRVGGNFQHLVFRDDTGTDHPIVTFDTLTVQGGLVKRPAPTFVEGLREGKDLRELVTWVEWAGGPALDSVILGLLRPKDYEASDLLPIHVDGGGFGIFQGSAGKHPFQLVKEIYDGQHSADGRVVRYDATALQALIDDPVFGVGWWRLTSVENMADWLEDNIYGPYGVVPFIDEQGRVAPRKMHLPQAIDPTTLFEFTAANCVEPPAWYVRGREVATVVRAIWLDERIPIGEGLVGGFDRLMTVPREVKKKHDRWAQVGEFVQTFQVTGLHLVDDAVTGGVTRMLERLAKETFDRYGDAPQYGGAKGLSTTASVKQGDFVRVTVATYPNPAILARGGTRIAQVVNKIVEPDGIRFEWLDAGPYLQPVAAPALALALNAGNGKHAVDVTISGLAVGDGYEIQVAQSVGAPSATSNLWRAAHNVDAAGATSEVVTIQPFPSGKSLWFRALRKNPLKIRSAWSTSQNITTTALSAATGLAVAVLSASDADPTWTVPAGSADYGVAVLLDTGSSQPTTVVGQLRPGSTFFPLRGLVVSTTYAVGVQFYDKYGGVSPITWTTFATSATVQTCPDLIGDGLVVLADLQPH